MDPQFRNGCAIHAVAREKIAFDLKHTAIAETLPLNRGTQAGLL